MNPLSIYSSIFHNYSDASDIEFDLALDDRVLANYSENLRFVLTQLAMNIPYLAVAGPTIFGEYKRGTNVRDNIYDRYEGKYNF